MGYCFNKYGGFIVSLEPQILDKGDITKTFLFACGGTLRIRIVLFFVSTNQMNIDMIGLEILIRNER